MIDPAVIDPATTDPDPRRAGVVTRLLAAAIDLCIVLLLTGGLFLGVAGVAFLWSPRSFTWPAESPLPATATGTLLAIGYLTLGWATTGRSYGGSLLGLRVLAAGGPPPATLGWSRAAARAVLCVLFPIGLLWAAVSRNRRSVQDAVVRSVVVYDWHRGGLPPARRSRR